jgi:hypothetical protein
MEGLEHSLGQKKSRTRLIDAIQNAFLQLGVGAGTETIQSITETVYQAMSAEGRYYHIPQHALALVDETDPIQTLAALYHDVVYTQVDQGFTPEIQKYIDPLMTNLPSGETGFQIEAAGTGDPGLSMVMDVFGFSPQPRAVSVTGSNEFLSSIVMVRKLENLLPMKVLIQITACIEATIPFRGTDQDGMGPFEQLAQRLKWVAQKFNVSFSHAELEETIQRAVRFANQDVGNFSLPDPAAFLEGTWKLLPESYPALRRGSEYTLGEYRKALEGMENFIRSIVAKDVLHRYKDFPSEDELREKFAKIWRNLAISKAYLEIKLFTMAILEALAHVSGGDAPVSTFLAIVDRIGDGNGSAALTSAHQEAPAEDINPTSEVYQLVERGVRGAVDFTDVKTAPLALYIYRKLGPRKVRAHLTLAREMFAGKINPDVFLLSIDTLVVAKVAEVMAQNAPGRGETLICYLGERTRSQGEKTDQVVEN